ncbi:ABC transporter ATP-binding protein [Actinomyces bowdenii]|uniref:ABC transporter ATP-binding protein n=1 Tax=Actinomyces bowdenii TaxID=131109 RepID=UPI001ABD0E71|nr:ABC transporter ATP-binding protein [Actinomyces bowdenii]MBO3724607.1 ABC transporter ATP-binding protein [Actinomyces bowdenii]
MADSTPPALSRSADPAATTAAGTPTGQDGGAPPEARAGQAALKDLLRPVRGYLMVGMLLSALSAVCALAPYAGLLHLGRILLDAHAAGQDPHAGRVQDAVALILGGLGARLVLYFLALSVTHVGDMRLAAQLRTRIVEVMARAPLSWFTESSSGRVRKAVQNDAHDLHYLVAHQYVEYTAAIVMPLAALLYALVIDWRLGLLAVATLPVYAAIQAWSMRGMGDLTRKVDAMLADVSARIVELVSGIAVVKAFGRAGRAHQRYTRAAQDMAEYYRAWCAPMLRSNALATSVIAPAVILLVNLSGGAAMVRAGWVDPLQVLATCLIALVLPSAIDTLGWSSWNNRIAGAAALRIMDVLSTEPLPEPARARSPRDGEIRFEDVSFDYGATRALDGVSLTLRPGTVTALVGASGSGKSTLATLLARFNDPAQGRVTLGGVDLRDVPAHELYRHVAFVLQDAQLLALPLVDNIRLARPGASLEQVRAAARAAQIDEVIMALPQGYDTVLGRGADLSGGQAQRVAIARAILADAPVLILDEATAFADPESEAAIQDALSELVRGRTVLVIAHRPAALVNADQVALLERGRLVAVGTHDELMADPAYAALWRAAAPDAPPGAPPGPPPDAVRRSASGPGSSPQARPAGPSSTREGRP